MPVAIRTAVAVALLTAATACVPSTTVAAPSPHPSDGATRPAPLVPPTASVTSGQPHLRLHVAAADWTAIDPDQSVEPGSRHPHWPRAAVTHGHVTINLASPQAPTRVIMTSAMSLTPAGLPSEADLHDYICALDDPQNQVASVCTAQTDATSTTVTVNADAVIGHYWVLQVTWPAPSNPHPDGAVFASWDLMPETHSP